MHPQLQLDGCTAEEECATHRIGMSLRLHVSARPLMHGTLEDRSRAAYSYR
jgi:hypothetical protein